MEKNEIKDIVWDEITSCDNGNHFLEDNPKLIDYISDRLYMHCTEELDSERDEIKDAAQAEQREALQDNEKDMMELIETYLYGHDEEDFILKLLGITKPTLQDIQKLEWFRENFDKIVP